MKTIKRIAPLSLAKIQAIIMAIFGLLEAIIALVTYAISPVGELRPLTIFLLPVLAGVVGFVAGLLIAWVYNLLASWFGGIKVELEK